MRRRGRPKLRWEDRVKLDMKELLLSEDMTSHRNEWRARTSLGSRLCAALFCLPVCCCSLLVGPSALFKLACPALVFYLSSLCLYVLFALLLSGSPDREALESGKPAVEAANVFYYVTYEGDVDLETIEDELQRSAIDDQIANFGIPKETP
ncbi:transport protein Sec24-like CEF [Tanacetum coccineum]